MTIMALQQSSALRKLKLLVQLEEERRMKIMSNWEAAE